MFDPNLMQPVNVGGMIQQGIEQGQKTREQNIAKGAMAALVGDPSNQRALEALAQVDPNAAMQFKQQQQQQQMRGLEAHRENIIKGAQLIRQINPKDDASWQQARALAQQAGIDVTEVPPHFDPQYVQGVIHLADTFAPSQHAQDPSSVREYEYAKQTGFGGSYIDFQQYIHPPSPVTLPANATVQSAPSQSGPQPGHVEDGYRFKGGNPADPNAWEPVGQGGAGQAAPQTFP